MTVTENRTKKIRKTIVLNQMYQQTKKIRKAIVSEQIYEQTVVYKSGGKREFQY